MRIPLCDVKANYLSCKDSIDTAINRVIEKSSYILGDEVKQFEQEYAAYCGSKYCIGVSNATSGLFLALKAMGVRGGDEIIIPTFTVNATIESVVMSGAKPVLCDVDTYGCINPIDIIDKITFKTRAIVCVHMFGAQCDMAQIMRIAKDHNLKIIEDCSHAHGLVINNFNAGTLGDFGVFSFFPSKVLGCFGDGGAVVTDNSEYAERISAYRDHGRIRGQKYEHEYLGYNMRLDGLQAAVLRAKLPQLNTFVAARQRIADNYMKNIVGTINMISRKNSSHYVFVISSMDRDRLADYLKTHEIQTGLHYPCPLHKMPYYSKAFGNATFPIAENLSNMVLSLPMFPELGNTEQDYIIYHVNKFYET